MTNQFSRLFCLSVCALLSLSGCSGSAKPRKEVELHPPGARPVQQASFVSATAPGYLPPAAPLEGELRPYDQMSEQQTAAEALGRIGTPAVTMLVQALQHSDPEVRLETVRVLIRMGPEAKDAVPALVPLLDDPDERIRKAATRALGRIGPDAAQAVEPLMRALLHSEPVAPPAESPPQ